MQLAPAKPIKPKAAATAANSFINLFIFISYHAECGLHGAVYSASDYPHMQAIWAL